MPCYTVNTISVEFKPESIGLLRKAAAALGWTVNEYATHVQITTDAGNGIVIKNGQATGASYDVNEIRRGYAQAVVGASLEFAKAKGWQVQKGSANKTTIKRGY